MKLSLPERWVLSRFYSTLAYVGGCLDEYKFNEAANALYDFVWHEFCDWYIEIAKTTISGKTSQIILYKMLEKSLRMLHPFMPFITEAIWQWLPHGKEGSGISPSEGVHSGGGSIMVQPWPRLQKEMISKEAEDRMRLLIEVVTAVRNIRAVWNIEPGREVAVFLNAHKAGDEKLLGENVLLIKALAKISDLKVASLAKPRHAATSVVGNIELYVPLEGVINFERERLRLEKEEAGLAAQVRALEERLRNRDFAAKAPKEVVAQQKAKKELLAQKLEKIKSNIKGLG
jgi:valyl-tRNA synthetase